MIDEAMERTSDCGRTGGTLTCDRFELVTFTITTALPTRSYPNILCTSTLFVIASTAWGIVSKLYKSLDFDDALQRSWSGLRVITAHHYHKLDLSKVWGALPGHAQSLLDIINAKLA